MKNTKIKLPLYWIDAFTTHVGSGNPAAVVPLDSWPADAVMQQIAFENGLSETAFFVRTGEARYHLRWFTPTVEVDLCGHATLAAADVLFRYRFPSLARLTFSTKSGDLLCELRGDRVVIAGQVVEYLRGEIETEVPAN